MLHKTYLDTSLLITRYVIIDSMNMNMFTLKYLLNN